MIGIVLKSWNNRDVTVFIDSDGDLGVMAKDDYYQKKAFVRDYSIIIAKREIPQLLQWLMPADDSEPVTEEWFADEFTSHEPHVCGGWEGLHFEVGCGVYVGVRNDTRELMICGCTCSLRSPSTRGDVRRLLAALL